jgi:3-deoxy-D-arabino-heptulosonate 7-phosphate (DAHP) synthase
MIDVHNDPETALSKGGQALKPLALVFQVRRDRLTAVVGLLSNQ